MKFPGPTRREAVRSGNWIFVPDAELDPKPENETVLKLRLASWRKSRFLMSRISHHISHRQSHQPHCWQERSSIDAVFVHRVGETALLLSTWQLNIRECDQRKTPHAPSRSAKKGVEGI